MSDGVIEARYDLPPSQNGHTLADVLDRDTEVATEPTIGTIARGSFVHVANSQWDEYDAKGVLIPGCAVAAARSARDTADSLSRLMRPPVRARFVAYGLVAQR